MYWMLLKNILLIPNFELYINYIIGNTLVYGPILTIN